MTNCKPCFTTVDTQAKLSANLGAPVADPTAYRSLADALQYLTFTRLYSLLHGSIPVSFQNLLNLRRICLWESALRESRFPGSIIQMQEPGYHRHSSK